MYLSNFLQFPLKIVSEKNFRGAEKLPVLFDISEKSLLAQLSLGQRKRPEVLLRTFRSFPCAETVAYITLLLLTIREDNWRKLLRQLRHKLKLTHILEISEKNAEIMINPFQRGSRGATQYMA